MNTQVSNYYSKFSSILDLLQRENRKNIPLQISHYNGSGADLTPFFWHQLHQPDCIEKTFLLIGRNVITICLQSGLHKGFKGLQEAYWAITGVTHELIDGCECL